MQIMQANIQAFQSVYLNPEAKSWKDTIILHDPIFQDEISGVIALKSYRLEDCLGLVLNAPLNRIRLFRDKIKKADNEEKWGKLEPEQILEKIMNLVTETGGTITYLQNKRAGTPNDVKDGEPSDRKWEPKELKKGKVASVESKYFFEVNIEKEVEAASYRVYSPSVNVFPEGIADNAKYIWNKSIEETADEIYVIEDTKERWDSAKYLFEKKCEAAGIFPYIGKLKTPEAVVAKLKKSVAIGTREIQDICCELEANGILERKSRLKFEDVQIMGSLAFALFRVDMKLFAKENVETAVAALAEGGFQFRQNVVRNLDSRTSVTIRMDANYKLTAYLSYSMPVDEVKILVGSKTESQSRCGLARVVASLKNS